MSILLNIAFELFTLWTIISITACEESETSKFTYNFPAYTLDFKPQTNEVVSGGNDEISSTEVLSVSTSISPVSTALPSGRNSLSSQTPSVSPVALNSEEIRKLGVILEQDKEVSTPKAPQTTEQSTASKADPSSTKPTSAIGSETNTTITNSTDSMLINGTTASTTSVPKVALSTEETKTAFDEFLKKGFSWLGDQYTLSIVVPILTGFLFAMVIIVTITVFACIRRRCRRRRFRKKILPETIRKMGPSDRARLLAETSDEEF